MYLKQIEPTLPCGTVDSEGGGEGTRSASLGLASHTIGTEASAAECWGEIPVFLLAIVLHNLANVDAKNACEVSIPKIFSFWIQLIRIQENAGF